jgi:negative regulator of sigma E activity
MTLKKPVLRMAVLALVLAAIPTVAFADWGDARDLVKQALEALPRASFVAKLKLSVPRGGVRQLELRHKFVGGARASYLEVFTPVELEGMRFLFLERPEGTSQQYFAIPGSHKIVQVSSEIRDYSFLGSDFYVADLIEPALDAYTYEFVGDTEVNGRRCQLVESTPKDPKKALYAKTVMAIDPINRLVLKRLFVGADRKLVKAWRVEKVEKVDGYWTLQDQRMKNVQAGTESRLQIIDIKYNVDLPDEMFTPKYLAR